MNRFVTVIFLAAAIVGIIFAWQLNSAPEAVSDTETAAGSTAPEAEQNSAQRIEPETGTAEPEGPPVMPPARLIRGGEAIEQDLAKAPIELPPSGNEKADILIDKVEKALAGDVDGLIDLSRLLTDCSRGMGSEEQLQQRLDRMARFQSTNSGGPAMPRRGGGGGAIEYQSFEEMEAAMWARFGECQVAKDVLDETLYEQVCRLAESGLPSARYLYAVWPPTQDSFLAVDTLELLEYQNLALEYTWSNMQAREPLGLLAMAQSYSANRPSMFTPNNFIQGQVFLLASMKCGIDNEWLEERSLNFGQGVSRFRGRNTEMPDLDGDATALAEMFCPAPPQD